MNKLKGRVKFLSQEESCQADLFVKVIKQRWNYDINVNVVTSWNKRGLSFLSLSIIEFATNFKKGSVCGRHS